MSTEIQELLQSLTHTTARLERVEPHELDRALTERGRAIDAIRRWIADEVAAARPVSADLAGQIAEDIDKGHQVMLRLALAREMMRSGRMAIDRELQVLHGIQGPGARGPASFSCRG